MATYGLLHDVLHSVLSLILWWGVASIVGGALFSMMRMGDQSEQLVPARNGTGSGSRSSYRSE